MLNIISRSAKTSRVGGQTKVFRNLVAGLDKLGYPYVVNRRLDACDLVWIHDDVRALPLIANLPPNIKVVVGPNLYVMPRDIPAEIDLSRAVYLHPSEWVLDLWKINGFSGCPLRAWPVGIDTDAFTTSVAAERSLVMVYHKHRRESELELVHAALDARKIASVTIRYGSYSQADYRSALSRSRYVIWHGCQESQGIALQEAMACGVPILIWDVRELGEFSAGVAGRYKFTQIEGSFPVTSAPYFDARSGIRATDLDEVTSGIEKMESTWRQFSPRDFILENLTLEKQADALLRIFEETWPGSSTPRRDVLRAGDWRPPISWIANAAWRRLSGR